MNNMSEMKVDADDVVLLIIEERERTILTAAQWMRQHLEGAPGRPTEYDLIEEFPNWVRFNMLDLPEDHFKEIKP